MKIDRSNYTTLLLLNTTAVVYRLTLSLSLSLSTKITLMENDDFDDLNPDPKQETFTTAVDGVDILKATMEKQEAKMRVFESHAAQEPDPDMDEVGLKEDPGLKPSLMGAKEEFAADVGEEALEDL